MEGQGRVVGGKGRRGKGGKKEDVGPGPLSQRWVKQGGVDGGGMRVK